MIKHKKREDGRIVQRITLPDGRKIDVYGYTEQELADKVKEIRKQADAGIIIGDNTTVSEWAQKWFTEYKGSVREHTKFAYQNAFNVHITPIIGCLRLKDVKPIHIQGVMNKISDKSESLQEKVLRTMGQIFRTAVDNNLILSSPVKNIKIVKQQKPDKLKALSEEQQRTIMNAVRGTRAELFTAIGLYCGLRREETCGLMWSDISDQERTLTVDRTLIFIRNRPEISPYLKTAAGHRTIPIPQPLYEILSSAERRGPYIVTDSKGQLLSETAYRRMWEIVTKAVLFEVTSHMLRHTYCTMLHKAGIDLKMAQYLMGHSDIKVTAKIYTHIENHQIQAAAQKLQGIFTEGKKEGSAD